MTALSWDLCPVYPCGLYAAPHRSAKCAGLRMSHSDIFCAREKCGGPKILFPTLLLKCVLVDSFFRHAFAFRRCCCPALVLNWRLFCTASVARRSYIHLRWLLLLSLALPSFTLQSYFKHPRKGDCHHALLFQKLFLCSRVETDFSTGYFQDPPPSLLHLSWVLGWVMHLLNALANFKVTFIQE